MVRVLRELEQKNKNHNQVHVHSLIEVKLWNVYILYIYVSIYMFNTDMHV